MDKIKPIKPSEIVERKIETIPNEMIKAFNDLIVKNWNGHEATIHQNKVVSAYLDNLELSEHPNDINRNDEKKKIFEYHWLDVEDIFREAGWNVSYDKPGYNETYEAYFVFSMKK